MALRTARQPGGVQYANPNYWVAYRWVPAECIEFYISLSFLRKACEIRGIGTWPSIHFQHFLTVHEIGENDFGVNFSLEEILAFKVQNLSMWPNLTYLCSNNKFEAYSSKISVWPTFGGFMSHLSDFKMSICTLLSVTKGIEAPY